MLSVLEKYTGVATFSSYEKMIDQGGLDAILVATPTSTHFACAQYALEHGLHLFVEKPLTLSPAESRALSELALAAQAREPGRLPQPLHRHLPVRRGVWSAPARWER